MKSNIESRQRFKERITEALKTITDNDELEEALAIVEDLDEIIEINALVAEYFYHAKNDAYQRWSYDDDDDDIHSCGGYNLTKMYDYIINRMDVFLGVGVHGGLWKNSQHWMATLITQLVKKAEKDGWDFKAVTPAHAPNPFVNNPFIVQPFPYIPAAPAKPTPPPSQYMTQLGAIIKQATNGNTSLVTVTHKTNGDFHLETTKGKALLTHKYVSSQVKLKNLDTGYSITFDDKHLSQIANTLGHWLV